jgi:hypothetical protein
MEGKGETDREVNLLNATPSRCIVNLDTTGR